MMKKIIEVKNLSKNFRLPHEKTTGLKQAIIGFGRDRGYDIQHVLKNISFHVNEGEFFGIVGRNGSGKSTLLKLLAQIYYPDSGSLMINGQLTPFIELGVGFNPELTGRENVYLNGALLGVDRKAMALMYDDIVEFAELEDFMDAKLKNYSSGMQVRLAFSVAIRVKNDILLLDEVLAVGDAAFQRKCYDYFMELKAKKSTVVLVTHDMNAIRQYCDRAILIEGGEIIHAGTPEDIAQEYQRLFTVQDSAITSRQEEDHWGNAKAVAVVEKISISQDTVTITSSYEAKVSLKTMVVGITVHGPGGINIMEDNTLRHKQKLVAIKPGDKLIYDWQIPNIFATGKYVVSVACCDQSTTEFYDWLNNAATFDITKEMATSGITNPTINLIKHESVE